MQNTKQLEKSYRIVEEMLYIRGYTDVQPMVDERDERGDEDFFYTLTFTYGNGECGGVMWPRSTKLGIDHIGMCTKYCENKEWTKYIVVCNGTITSCAKKELLHNIRITHKSEIFYVHELQNNITTHKYVPKHRKLSENEKNDIVKMYKTNVKNYPQMLETDPIARYYNFVEDDLIEITRKNNMGYRYVIKF